MDRKEEAGVKLPRAPPRLEVTYFITPGSTTGKAAITMTTSLTYLLLC